WRRRMLPAGAIRFARRAVPPRCRWRGRRGDDPSRARGGESRARNHAPRRARGGRAPRQGRGRLRPRKARRVGDDLVANTPRPPGAKMRERAFKLARAEASGNRNPPPGDRPAVQWCSASRWRGPLDTATTARPTMTETLRMRIDSIAHGGEGIGTLPSGKRVFVPLAAPGDQVEVEIVERRPRYERSEEHTSELQSRENLVCRLLLE